LSPFYTQEHSAKLFDFHSAILLLFQFECLLPALSFNDVGSTKGWNDILQEIIHFGQNLK
jgi:hypothetical protein